MEEEEEEGNSGFVGWRICVSRSTIEAMMMMNSEEAYLCVLGFLVCYLIFPSDFGLLYI